MGLTEIGMKAADYLTAGAISGLMEIGQDDRQIQQQKNLTDIQIRGGQRMSKFNKDLEYELWKKTNLQAQVKEADLAGLNPSILYGKGGQPAQTGAGAAMPSGGTAGDPNAAIRNTMDIAMQRAQIANMEASTNKMNVEAEKTGGVDTQHTEASIANITQGIKNQKAAEALTRLQTEAADIQNQVGKVTIGDAVSIIRNGARKAQSEADSALAQANVDQSTQEIKKKTIAREYTNMLIEAQAMETGIALEKAKINEITTGIQQEWEKINNQQTANSYEHQDRVKSIEEYTSNALKVAGIMAAGQIIGDVARIATRQAPKWQQTGKSLKSEYDGAGNPIKQTRTEQWNKK